VVVAQAFTAAAALAAAAARLSVSVGLGMKPQAPPASTASRAPTVRRAQPVSRINGIGEPPGPPARAHRASVFVKT
ncbi:MAG: hypothetical protein WCB92_29430, partial [Mycobacterium sp.]